MILTILVFILILSILVFIHEAGHFFAAKRFGIKVEEFGFGLPPKLWGIKKGETMYSINWLPFGGFVKLFGEDDAGAGKIQIESQKVKVKSQEDTDSSEMAEEDATRAFTAKPLATRMIVVTAGVIMNLILAVVLYYIILTAQGFTAQIPLVFDTNHRFVGAQQENVSSIVIAQAIKDSPIEKAGVVAGDRVIAYDDNPVITVDQFVAYVNDHKGKAVALRLVDKADHERDVSVIPRIIVPPGQGPLGIGGMAEITIAKLHYQSPTQKVLSGFSHAYNIGAYSFEVFGKIIATSFRQHDIKPVSEGVAGPVGIGRIVGQILSIGGSKAFLSLLDFMALLSLNLAVVNVLPFPALDGGRFFFLLIEGMTQRKINATVERYANTIGMAVLLGLIFLVTFNDLSKLFRGG